MQTSCYFHQGAPGTPGGSEGASKPRRAGREKPIPELRRGLGARQWARERRMLQVKLRHELLNSTLTMIQDKEGEPKGCSVF